MTRIPWLEPHATNFPPTAQALVEPNGLLAAGGSLTPDVLLHAYQRGIFPWSSEGEPILWWTPNPRCVVFPKQAHCAKSLAKLFRKGTYQIKANSAFEQVISACARTRQADGTWITPDLTKAFCDLAEQGFAQSIEVWEEQELVGGLYGLAINGVFFGESMFSLRPNTSKLAFIWLARALDRLDYRLIDCQVTSEHLLSLGAQEIARTEFERIIDTNVEVIVQPEYRLTELASSDWNAV
jgi:leucyl/phenylalanyl-tRNA--protein transferase